MKAELIDGILPRLDQLLQECCLCGHHCAVNRFENAVGFCRASSADRYHAQCSSYTLHFGEEPMLVGRGGSGTVFFTHCNLRCVFCQNFQISQLGMGDDIHFTDLARIFIGLQEDKAENINLVTPTHYIYPILLGLRDAYRDGLNIPLVYNTNGYDSVELLSLLEGIVDVYLPDMKYMDAALARKYSSAEGYPEVAQNAIKEMYRQVGPVRLVRGVAQRGVIIRHLILPQNIAGTYDFLLWLKSEGMLDVTIGLMSQYSPQYRAQEFPELRNRISQKEYRDIVRYALGLGFEHVLTQGLESTELYLPDFEKDYPFSD